MFSSSQERLFRESSESQASHLVQHEEHRRHIREIANPIQNYSPREIRPHGKRVQFVDASSSSKKSSTTPTSPSNHSDTSSAGNGSDGFAHNGGPSSPHGHTLMQELKAKAPFFRRDDTVPNLTSPLSPKNALQATINMTSRLVPTRKVNKKTYQSKRPDGLMRAYYGTILAIIERPKSRGCLLIALNFMYPFLSVIIDFIQFSIINSATLPTGSKTINMDGFIYMDLWESLKKLPYFYIAFGMVGGLFTVLCIMALQFGFREKQHHRIVVNVLASYVAFVSGVLYIPLVNLLSHEMVDNLEVMDGAHIKKILTAIAIGIMILLFIPFCVFYSQNSGYIGDEFAFHLRKRKHSRMEMLLILVKTLVVFGRSLGHSWARISLNMVLFVALFLGHFLTSVYYISKVNYLYTGLYLCLVEAAVTNFAQKCLAGHPSAFSANYYWYTLPAVFVIGVVLQYYSYSWVGIYHVRFKINLFLMNSFQNLDLADNPELIHRFQLATLLHTATRLGKYARFLANLDANDKRPEGYFLRALEQEPNHCEILGWYAEYLAKQEGRASDADIFYQRAILAGPNHRDNLEGYAWFLRQRNTPESLFYYQRSLLQYYEHFEYRDMYANSPDPMMIVAQDGTIIDVNGASMYFFCTTKRKQLCNFKTTIFDLTSSEHIERLKAKINEVVWEAFHTKFECRMKTYLNKLIICEVVLTRMKHHRRSMIHVALNDRTEIHKLLDKTALLGVVHKLSSQSEHRELSRLLFENSCTVQIMAAKKNGLIERFNYGAELYLGFSRNQIVGKHLSTIIPPQVLNEFEEEPDHEHGSDNREGFTRDIEVKVGDGSVKPFLVRLALFNLNDVMYIFASMIDLSRYINSRPCFPTAQQRDLIVARSPRAMESAGLVNLLFEMAPSPMFMVDEVGVITRINPKATMELGYTVEDVVGKSIAIFMPSEMKTDRRDILEAFLHVGSRRQPSGGAPQISEIPFQCKDGQIKMCIVEVAELRGGARTYYIGVIHGTAALPPFLALEFAHNARLREDQEQEDLEAGMAQNRPLLGMDPYTSLNDRRGSDKKDRERDLACGPKQRGNDGVHKSGSPKRESQSSRQSQQRMNPPHDKEGPHNEPIIVPLNVPLTPSKLGISSWADKEPKMSPTKTPTIASTTPALSNSHGATGKKVPPSVTVTVHTSPNSTQAGGGASNLSSPNSEKDGADSPSRRISVSTVAKAILSLTPNSQTKKKAKKATTMLSAERRSAMTPQQLDDYEREGQAATRRHSRRNTALRRSSKSSAPGQTPETSVSLEQQKKMLESLNKGKDNEGSVVNDSSAAALAILGNGIII